LKRTPFDPTITKLIYNLKLGGESELNPFPNLFFSVKTPEALQWLLEHLGDQQSREQLLQAKKETEHRTVLLQYLYDGQLKLVKMLEKHFGDCTFLFSFPDNKASFLLFAQHCATKADLRMLKRGVG
jgi:hypothetical protein